MNRLTERKKVSWSFWATPRMKGVALLEDGRF